MNYGDVIARRTTPEELCSQCRGRDADGSPAWCPRSVGTRAATHLPVVGAARSRTTSARPATGWSHQGNDLMAQRRTVAVAAEAGQDRNSGRRPPRGLHALRLERHHPPPYIHLNNDLTQGNDNRGQVRAGAARTPRPQDGVGGGRRAIGYVGKSVTRTLHPHLHFEVHPNDGGAVNPYRTMKAERLIFRTRRRP